MRSCHSIQVLWIYTAPARHLQIFRCRKAGCDLIQQKNGNQADRGAQTSDQESARLITAEVIIDSINRYASNLRCSMAMTAVRKSSNNREVRARNQEGAMSSAQHAAQVAAMQSDSRNQAIHPHIAAECKVSPTPDNGKKAVAEAGEIMVKLRHPSCGRLHRLCEEDLKMKTTLGIKIAAIAAFAALAGCTDLKPLQADIDSLKTQVGKLQSDLAGKADKSAVDAANASATAAATAGRNAGTAAAAAQTSANSASSKADAAQAAANKAQADAAAAQAAVADLNTKVDRMFQKSVSK